jgi:hypothetical protein
MEMNAPLEELALPFVMVRALSLCDVLEDGEDHPAVDERLAAEESRLAGTPVPGRATDHIEGGGDSPGGINTSRQADVSAD